MLNDQEHIIVKLLVYNKSDRLISTKSIEINKTKKSKPKIQSSKTIQAKFPADFLALTSKYILTSTSSGQTHVYSYTEFKNTLPDRIVSITNEENPLIFKYSNVVVSMDKDKKIYSFNLGTFVNTELYAKTGVPNSIRIDLSEPQEMDFLYVAERWTKLNPKISIAKFNLESLERTQVGEFNLNPVCSITKFSYNRSFNDAFVLCTNESFYLLNSKVS